MFFFDKREFPRQIGLFFVFEWFVVLNTEVYFSSVGRKAFGGVINGLVCGSFSAGDKEYCLLLSISHKHFGLYGGRWALFVEPIVYSAVRIGF